MANSFGKRWEIVEQLGSGGQGLVHKVVDLASFPAIDDLMKRFTEEIRRVGFESEGFRQEWRQQIYGMLRSISSRERDANVAALKVLHIPAEARDAKTMYERFRREVHAVKIMNHPNIIRLLDVNVDEGWYVSPYYSRGTLNTTDGYKGNLLGSLLAIRPVVEGVAAIHSSNMVHRDIKPANIFIDDSGSLVLGDFGLIFFTDDSHTRISETFDNVGTWDWMPEWATGKRIEEIDGRFDVFSLGKVLWAMISGRPIFRLWKFGKPENDLTKLFPNSPEMHFANELFAKCIVEEHHDCLPDAKALLEEIDGLVSLLKSGGTPLSNDIFRRCGICGIGIYQVLVWGDNDSTQAENWGFRFGAGTNSFKICACSHCGHVQQFLRTRDKEPPAWQ